jgi:uncharacterized protein involved in exopolysaccharide biosynthesis
VLLLPAAPAAAADESASQSEELEMLRDMVFNPPEKATPTKPVGLKYQVEDLRKRNAELRDRIAKLEAALAGGSSGAKAMMGFDAATPQEQITSAFEADMKTYGAEAPEEMRNYRALVRFQGRQIEVLKEEIEHFKKQIGAHRQGVVKADESGDAQRAAMHEELKRATQALSAQREAFEAERTRLMQDKQALEQELARTRQERAEMLQRGNREIERLSAELARLTGQQKAGPSAAAPRTWTDATGRFSVEAVLVEVKDGKAMLRRADGHVIAVPVANLSEADRDYLSSLDKNTR